MDSEDKDMITVEYRSEHTGHFPKSNNDDVQVHSEEVAPSKEDLRQAALDR